MFIYRILLLGLMAASILSRRWPAIECRVTDLPSGATSPAQRLIERECRQPTDGL